MAQWTEQWMGKPKRDRLEISFGMCAAKQGAVIEVGCWEGRSTQMIANNFPESEVICVDHWMGDLTDQTESGKRVAQLAKDRDVFATFKANMDELTAGNYKVARMDWRKFAQTFRSPIRYIFIDGQHTYEEVLDNIAWALPLVVPGGIIAGDDYTVPPVARAIRDAGLTDPQLNLKSGPGRAIWIYTKS